jgi:hypothetical protein
MAWGWSQPRAMASASTLAAHGEACRELSAKVQMAWRKRLLQAQRKLTERWLPDWRVTGVAAARQAAASGPS